MVIVFSLIRLPQVSSPIPTNDKLLHLVCYFALTYWFLHTYPKKPIHIVLGFIVVGTLMELLQSVTTYRFFEWLDIVMNFLGVSLAVFMFCVFNLRVKYLISP